MLLSPYAPACHERESFSNARERHSASADTARRVSEVHSLGPSPRNGLLAALPAQDLANILPHLEPVTLAQRSLLFEPNQPITHVYFPDTAVVSLINLLDVGGTVEVGTVGCEGIAGLPAFLHGTVSSSRAVVQIPGTALRCEEQPFARLAAAPSELHRLLLRYTLAFLTQVAQTAACNAAHLVQERCARWLLMTHDRVAGDQFPLTHEFLAFMLGVRRAGVTTAMRALQDAGMVDYTRGRIAILDRAALEGASCECYRVVRRHFDQLLPRVA